MVKLICDKCLEEVSHLNRVVEYSDAKDTHGAIIAQFPKDMYELCDDCYDRFKRFDIDIADFIRLSKKELDFLDNTFKVGDEVITATGKVGKITDICTCEKCQERGFYEPSVEVEVGYDGIWITDRAKESNFASFYKIGNHIYGNIDEDEVDAHLRRVNQQMDELVKEKSELHKQKEVIRKIQKHERDGEQ